MKSRPIIVARLAALALIAATAASCKKSDEDRIKAIIRSAVSAVEQKSASRVLEHAGEGFKGPDRADIRECRRILLGYFLSQGWIRAFDRDLTVTVDSDRATAKLEILLAKGNPVKKIEDVIPTNADLFEFDLALAKQGGDWRFTSATYKRLPH
jgi:hypothetical protein